MTRRPTRRTSFALATASLALSSALLGAGVGKASSTPVGPLPVGPIAATNTKPGLLVAVALPHASRSSGLVWRVARRYDSSVVKQVSEADVAGSVVLVFRVVGRGDTALVFALTRGDASPKAVKSQTHRIHST
jgi:hypothetical protein